MSLEANILSAGRPVIVSATGPDVWRSTAASTARCRGTGERGRVHQIRSNRLKNGGLEREEPIQEPSRAELRAKEKIKTVVGRDFFFFV